MDDDRKKVIEAKIEEHRQELTKWTEEFEATQGRPPKIADIEADALARQYYNDARELEMSIAPPPAEDGCQYYIPRRRRFCTRRRADGHDQFCTEHARVTETTSNISIDNSCLAAVPTPQQAESTDSPENDAAFRFHKKTNITRRMKRMTNPLAQQHAVTDTQALADEISNAFTDTSLPVFLDIGCARGGFLQKLALHQSANSNPHMKDQYNFLGIEIFAPLVERANKWRDENEATRGILHCVAGTAQSILKVFKSDVSDENITNLPPLKVEVVCIQFPDPWSKKHKRRRLVDEEFANLIADILVPAGQVYFASDYEEIAEDIKQAFLSTDKFECLTESWAPGGNPYGAGTERDEVCELNWRQAWRMRLIRL